MDVSDNRSRPFHWVEPSSATLLQQAGGLWRALRQSDQRWRLLLLAGAIIAVICCAAAG